MSRKKKNVAEGLDATDIPNETNASMREQKACNSPEWLTHNPELTESAGRLNFATRLGVSYDIGSTEIPAVLNNPSCMNFYYVPAIGVSDDASSAVNMAASQMAAFMRTKISGSRNYEPNDLMIYILGLSSIVDAINLAVRAYGVARYYNPWDITAPAQYLRAMGFEPGSIMNDMAYANGLINKAILKLSVFAIPGTLPYLLRHRALTANIFADGELVHRAQKYMFTPINFWKFDPTSDPNGGKLAPVFWIPDARLIDPANDTGDLRSIDAWYAMVDDMLDAYVNDSDVWTIDGDIRRAYEGNLLPINTIPMDYSIVPLYDAGISTQMENLTILNCSPNFVDTGTGEATYIGNSLGVYQDINDNRLVFKPLFRLSGATAVQVESANMMTDDVALINFHWDNPTSLDVAYACQMTTLYSSYYEDLTYFTPRSCQCEIVVYCNAIDPATDITMSISTTSFNNNRTVKEIGVLSSFDWHPTVHILNWDAKEEELEYLTTVCEKDNWAIIDARDLKQLHEAGLLSYFNVPQR